MDPITATVALNPKPSLGPLTVARLKRRNDTDVSVEPNDAKPLAAVSVQYDLVLAGGDAPKGHVLASSRERSWAERMAAALNKSKHSSLSEAEKQVRGLMALGG